MARDRHRPAVRARLRHALGVAAVVAGDPRRPTRCSTSVTSHCGQPHTRAHDRHDRKFDQPRRLSSTIAFSPRSRTPSSATRVRSCSGPVIPAVPTISTGGIPRPSTRSGIDRRRSRRQLSGRGVAVPGEQHGAGLPGAALGDVAGVVARVALLLVGRVVLLVDHDQSEVGDRREHRRARPDAHARLPPAQPQPLVAALGRCRASSAAPRPRRRSAARSARRSAASARSPARARSPTGRDPGRPRLPAGRPRSCRCR